VLEKLFILIVLSGSSNFLIEPEKGSHSRRVCFSISIMFEDEPPPKYTWIVSFCILESPSMLKKGLDVQFDQK
tara:strand:- start:2701 stop:2919 length:219 start_codon:yes stop_codon:yes gene_type:complete